MGEEPVSAAELSIRGMVAKQREHLSDTGGGANDERTAMEGRVDYHNASVLTNASGRFRSSAITPT